jgi:hypothetical protein
VPGVRSRRVQLATALDVVIVMCRSGLGGITATAETRRQTLSQHDQQPPSVCPAVTSLVCYSHTALIQLWPVLATEQSQAAIKFEPQTQCYSSDGFNRQGIAG